MRGGSLYNIFSNVRCAGRLSSFSYDRAYNVGFRVVRQETANEN
jgi:hypothetical protein